MKTIIIILATGTLLNFPLNSKIDAGCFEQGQAIIEEIAHYEGPGPEQGWYLNNGKGMVAGFYCD